MSAFIDGTNVYGFTEELLEILRDHGDGRKDHRHLFMPEHSSKFGSRLPTTRDATVRGHEDTVKSFETPPFLNEKREPDFVAGDTRCSENMMLNSLHHTFARLHNNLADGLANAGVEMSEDDLFFEARQINIAIMNNIGKP